QPYPLWPRVPGPLRYHPPRVSAAAQRLGCAAAKWHWYAASPPAAPRASQRLCRNPIPVHADTQPERHFDPRQRTLVDVFGLEDVHLGLVLHMLIDNEPQITLVPGRAGRNVKVLLYG